MPLLFSQRGAAVVHELSPQGRAALGYAARGWHVLPCGGESGKIPLTKHGVHEAATDRNDVARWWQRWPSANVGVATGSRSGFWALDIDGAEGLATLCEIERAHGALPQTIMQETPKGGLHFLFSYRPGGDRIGNKVRALPNVDTRSNGGYILVAPSFSPSAGRAWAWRPGRVPGVVPTAPAPEWLIAALTAPKPADQPGTADIKPWVAAARGTISEGARNSSATSVLGHLLRRFVDPYLAVSLLRAWNTCHCVPPIADDELDVIIKSIINREALRREGMSK